MTAISISRYLSMAKSIGTKFSHMKRISDDSDEYTVGFEPDETFGKFVQRMAASSMKDTGIVPTKDDKVVTLSTCSTSGETYRFVVHGVRVDEH